MIDPHSVNRWREEMQDEGSRSTHPTANLPFNLSQRGPPDSIRDARSTSDQPMFTQNAGAETYQSIKNIIKTTMSTNEILPMDA